MRDGPRQERQHLDRHDCRKNYFRHAFRQHAALRLPAFTFFVSTTHMGYGVDEAAINQAESRSGESGTQAQTVGVVTNDQRRSWAAHVLAVNDCDRNTLTVGRNRAEPIEHIATAIEPAACKVLL